jgi:26S proteasome regulatory subunit N4
MEDLHAPTVASGPTSHSQINGTEKEPTFQELVTQKENLEAELDALGSVLDSVWFKIDMNPRSEARLISYHKHGVNMNTSLTTFDGYPRADIDVAQIRTTRARIIRLKNDHKAVMKKLEVAVQEQFAAKAAENEASRAQEQAQPTEEPSSSSAIEPPFARVNTVTPRSPADQAGLKADDKVVRFGTANFTNHERLRKVAQVVQQNENVRFAPSIRSVQLS